MFFSSLKELNRVIRSALKYIGLPSPASVFEFTRQVGNFFYHFEMEMIALILTYNILVTKKIFFRNKHQKKILTANLTRSQTDIFLSLVSVKNSQIFP